MKIHRNFLTASLLLLCIAIYTLSDAGNATAEYSIGEYLNSLKDEAVNKLHQEVAETKVTVDGNGNVVINNDNLSINVTELSNKFSNEFSNVTQGINLFQGNETQTKNMTTKLQNATLVAKEEVKKETISRYKSARK